MNSAEAADDAALPFAILEELGLNAGYERSFKVTRGSILANRYMLGVPTDQLSPDPLRVILDRLKTPSRLRDSLEAQSSEANLLFVGFEETWEGVRYKLYLEFWQRLIDRLTADPANREPAILHRGYKWNPHDPEQCAVADYCCYPLITHREMAQRIEHLFAGRPDALVCRQSVAILQAAAARVPNRAFIYAEASESGGPRHSFDVNLYRAGLRWGEVQRELQAILDDWSISSESTRRLWDRIADQDVGHLSAGVDRNGRAFFTGYFPVHSAMPKA